MAYVWHTCIHIQAKVASFIHHKICSVNSDRVSQVHTHTVSWHKDQSQPPNRDMLEPVKVCSHCTPTAKAACLPESKSVGTRSLLLQALLSAIFHISGGGMRFTAHAQNRDRVSRAHVLFLHVAAPWINNRETENLPWRVGNWWRVKLCCERKCPYSASASYEYGRRSTTHSNIAFHEARKVMCNCLSGVWLSTRRVLLKASYSVLDFCRHAIPETPFSVAVTARREELTTLVDQCLHGRYM